MNREFESGILSDEDNEHRMRLWWTVYMIDRKLTYLMGVPLSLHDVDITVPKPALHSGNTGNDTAAAFALHIHLSTELGRVLYGKDFSELLGCMLIFLQLFMVCKDGLEGNS
jgi:proline utilization trans-activator